MPAIATIAGLILAVIVLGVGVVGSLVGSVVAAVGSPDARLFRLPSRPAAILLALLGLLTFMEAALAILQLVTPA